MGGDELLQLTDELLKRLGLTNARRKLKPHLPAPDASAPAA